jgi:hypothetical protein
VVRVNPKTPGGGTVRQAVGEVQSLEWHQYKSAMVLRAILIKNKVFLHYKMVFNEILNHNVCISFCINFNLKNCLVIGKIKFKIFNSVLLHCRA